MALLKRKRDGKATLYHYQMIVEELESHPNMATLKFSDAQGHKKNAEFWNILASKLNSIGTIQKNAEKWQKCWTDWKCKLKHKAALIKTAFNETGGGSPPNVTLTPLEERALGVVGWSLVEGDGKTPDGGFTEEAEHVPSVSPVCVQVLDHTEDPEKVVAPPAKKKLRTMPHSSNKAAEHQLFLDAQKGVNKLQEAQVSVLNDIKNELCSLNKNVANVALEMRRGNDILDEGLEYAKTKCAVQ